MADYGELGSRTLAEVGHSLTTEGLGVVLGLFAAGFAGRQVQNRIKSDPDVLADPTLINYAKAWAGNNLPKVALWYLARKYGGGTELMTDAKKAVSGSIVLDTGARLFNKGVNPYKIEIGGFQFLGDPELSGTGEMSTDVKHVLQENKDLRAELSKATKMLNEANLETPREKRYGFMKGEESLQKRREDKYGFMNGGDGTGELAARFGML